MSTVTAESKASLIRQHLSSEHGWNDSNDVIARAVGCSESTVRKARAEMEAVESLEIIAELREENNALKAENEALKSAASAPRRPKAPRPAKPERPTPLLDLCGEPDNN